LTLFFAIFTFAFQKKGGTSAMAVKKTAAKKSSAKKTTKKTTKKGK